MVVYSVSVPVAELLGGFCRTRVPVVGYLFIDEPEANARRIRMTDTASIALPLDWATAENNLGNALLRLGQPEAAEAALPALATLAAVTLALVALATSRALPSVQAQATATGRDGPEPDGRGPGPRGARGRGGRRRHVDPPAPAVRDGGGGDVSRR